MRLSGIEKRLQAIELDEPSGPTTPIATDDLKWLLAQVREAEFATRAVELMLKPEFQLEPSKFTKHIVCIVQIDEDTWLDACEPDARQAIQNIIDQIDEREAEAATVAAETLAGEDPF